MTEFTPDEIFEVPYPFVRGTVELYDEDGPCKIDTWIPGTRFVPVAPDDSISVADKMGVHVLTVISTHKPGRFPTRIFYTQGWITPEGKRFGKTRCCVTTVSNFRTKLKGYRYEFEMSVCGDSDE